MEQQVVLLAASVENDCEFYVLAHSLIVKEADKLTMFASGRKQTF